MNIHDLKRWQWAVVGLLAGLMGGWVWSMNAGESISAPATLGSQQFERDLAAPLLEGHPKVKNIVVHPSGGRYWVSMKVLEPDPADPHPANRRYYRYIAERLNATTPYFPRIDMAPTQTVMVRVNPSALSIPRQSGKRGASEPLPLWINTSAAPLDELSDRLHLDAAWEEQPGKWCDPHGGARMTLTLGPANYQVLIVLASNQSPAAAGGLTIELNGHVLLPCQLEQTASGACLRTTAPRGAFAGAGPQVFTFSRKSAPVRIWEIRLIDPTYTVADYLAYARAKNPRIRFTLAWWEKPWLRYAICAAAGVAFFAGVWPLLLALFTGSWGGRSDSNDPEYDLDRFKGEPAAKARGKSLAGVDMEHSNWPEDADSGPSPAPPQAKSEPPSIIHPLSPETAAAPLVEPVPDDAEYRGEYYPVAKPAVHKPKTPE